MNLYIRYFDDEAVVPTPDAGYQFLCEALNEQADVKYLDALREYYESPVNYTKRVKVRPRVYFVAIKTEAGSLEEFKERGKQMAEARALKEEGGTQCNPFEEERFGWYEGALLFKRVLFNVDTNKNEYVDTEFVAQVKANSVAEAYKRICDYLTNHPDVDPRSQLPSIKGKNFRYKFLGETINA